MARTIDLASTNRLLLFVKFLDQVIDLCFDHVHMHQEIVFAQVLNIPDYHQNKVVL